MVLEEDEVEGILGEAEEWAAILFMVQDNTVLEEVDDRAVVPMLVEIV